MFVGSFLPSFLPSFFLPVLLRPLHFLCSVCASLVHRLDFRFVRRKAASRVQPRHFEALRGFECLSKVYRISIESLSEFLCGTSWNERLMFVRYVYFHLPNTLLRERARKYTHSNMKLRSGKTTAPRCRRFSHLIKHHIASQFLPAIQNFYVCFDMVSRSASYFQIWKNVFLMFVCIFELGDHSSSSV